MSAVSMKLTPSSTARRSTRTPSSASSTMRIAPKPRRRTSSSPPITKVVFTARMLVRNAGLERPKPLPLPGARQRRRVLESIADRDDHLRPRRRPDVSPGEVLGRGEADVQTAYVCGSGERRRVVVDGAVVAGCSAVLLDERLERERGCDEGGGDRRRRGEGEDGRATPGERG